MMAPGTPGASSPRTAFLADRKDSYRRPLTLTQLRFAREAARRTELDRIRIERRLTAAELAEADLLAGRLYMREYRAQLALATAALS